MKQLHKIQIQILKKLLFADSLTYTAMKPDKEMGNNQFDFHVDSLIKLGLIKKEDSIYLLTETGKEYANRMDTDIEKILFQAKLSAWIACTRIINKRRQFLIGTRKKQPFFGKQGFISGKIRFGETVYNAAERELLEETGLKGKPELVLINHYIVFQKETGKLVEDKFMFLCKVESPRGNIQLNNEVDLAWVFDDEIEKKVKNPFVSIDELTEILKILKDFDHQIKFRELKVETDEF